VPCEASMNEECCDGTKFCMKTGEQSSVQNQQMNVLDCHSSFTFGRKSYLHPKNFTLTSAVANLQYLNHCM